MKIAIKFDIYQMKRLREYNNNKRINYSTNKTLIELEKKELLKFISKTISKNITQIKQIFLGQKLHFGNQIITVSKVIFYCQILGCKKIILENNSNNWYFKKKIIIRRLFYYCFIVIFS